MLYLNWHVGWALIAIGMLSGAGIGLGFGSDDFWGGYQSFRRRLARLGHIACIALGAGNLCLHQLTRDQLPTQDVWLSMGLWAAAAGAIAMPAVCFLSAARKGFRHLFFVPVSLLLVTVVLMWWRITP